MSSTRCPVCSWLLFFEGNGLVDVEEGDSKDTLTFCVKVGLAEIKEDDPEDANCNKRKKISF